MTINLLPITGRDTSENYYQLLPSTAVKVFPCGRRRVSSIATEATEATNSFDIESRLSTERNNRIRSAIGAYNNSFLESWSVNKIGRIEQQANSSNLYYYDSKIVFVVDGYHFTIDYSITTTEEDVIDTNLDSNAINLFCQAILDGEPNLTSAKKLYAVIKTEDIDIVRDSKTVTATNKTPILTHVTNSNTTFLDISVVEDDEENYYFNGLGLIIAETAPTNCKYLALAEYDSFFNTWELIKGGVMEAAIEQTPNTLNEYTLRLTTNQRRPPVFSTDLNGVSFVCCQIASNNVIITGYTSTVTGNLIDLTIPATIDYNGTTYYVKGIAPLAFANNSDIEKLTIANGVEVVGEDAFANCTSLVEITIPENIVLKDSAFRDCINLIKVTTVDQPQAEANT